MTRKATACALVGVFLLCSAVALADGDGGRMHGRYGIAGTWLVKVVFEPGTALELKLQYLQTLNADGRTTLLLPTGGPSDYPETGDPRIGCMGEWRPRTPTTHSWHRVFDMMLLCLPTQQWEPTGADPTSYQELQVKATLSKDGKRWTGPFVISNYAADGAQLFTGPGTMEATRVEVKPLP